MKRIFVILFSSLFFFLFAGNFASQNVAFAQDSASATSSAENTPVWLKQSTVLRKIGWSFFGVGLALDITGPVVLLVGGASNAADGNAKGAAKNVVYGYTMTGLGSAMVISGITLLIVDAVLFNPYRRGEISQNGFSLKPDFYVSPQFSGFGISGTF